MKQEGSYKARDLKIMLRTLVVLALPTVAEEVLTTLLQYVDTAMVGQLGEQATAAVSVTTTINWLIGSLAGALGVAVLAMISRAYGAGEEERMRVLSSQVVLVAVVSGAILTVAALILSPFIPVWMGAEWAVRGEASAYFSIISLALLFRTGSVLFASAIRATQNTMLPMLISLFCNLLNAGLNYVLIYRAGLGVRGAACASAISYTFSGILMYIAYRRNRYLRWRWRDFRVDAAVLREGAGLCLPVLGTSFVSCMGYVFFAGLVSGMGTTVFAAHSIAVTAETIFYIPGYGLRTATSALVGAALGEKNKSKFEQVVLLSVGLTVGMMVFSGLFLYAIAEPLMGIFSSSGRVIALGAGMLRLVAFSEPFFGLMIVMEGIFYGLGKTRYAFLVESGSMWGIRIFFTFLCVRVWGMDLRAVWYCMIADNVVKALLFAAPVLRKKGRDGLFVAKGPYTIDDIYELPEGERAELIDGRIYYMAPPSWTHQRISGRLYQKIANYIDQNGGKCEVLPAPFAVFLNKDNFTYVEPDISVICDLSKLDDRGCHGAPDWVIEIVSPGSRPRDYMTKLFQYRAAGVREYWIVDPEKQLVSVYAFEKDEVEQYRFSEDVPVGIYEGFSIRLRSEE